jgi:hypothetical protein
MSNSLLNPDLWAKEIIEEFKAGKIARHEIVLCIGAMRLEAGAIDAAIEFNLISDPGIREALIVMRTKQKIMR